MDDRTKFLKRLQSRDLRRINTVIGHLQQGNITGLDIKKLKGYSNMFRVRVGDFRIVYKKDITLGIIILEISRRSDTTYNIA